MISVSISFSVPVLVEILGAWLRADSVRDKMLLAWERPKPPAFSMAFDQHNSENLLRPVKVVPLSADVLGGKRGRRRWLRRTGKVPSQERCDFSDRFALCHFSGARELNDAHHQALLEIFSSESSVGPVSESAAGLAF